MSLEIRLILLITSSQQSSQEVKQLKDRMAKGTSDVESLIQSLNRVTKANQTLEHEKADLVAELKVYSATQIYRGHVHACSTVQ